MGKNILKERIEKVRQEKGIGRSQELRYLGYEMRELTQEKLISLIDELDFLELKTLFAAGVPGSAYLHALNKYTQMRTKVEEYSQRVG